MKDASIGNGITVVCGSRRVFIRVWRREVVGELARPLKVVALLIRAIPDHYLNIEEILLCNNCISCKHRNDKEPHLHNNVQVLYN